jgi:hypothetical protein
MMMLWLTQLSCARKRSLSECSEKDQRIHTVVYSFQILIR